MNVCVFCGSGTGHNPVFGNAARALGQALLMSQCGLVYGGGNVGLMGIVADEVLSGGGKVIGVIPGFLMEKELGHKGITQLEVVKTMHERKKRMADLSDASLPCRGAGAPLTSLPKSLHGNNWGLFPNP